MDNVRFLSIDYLFYQIYTFFVWVGSILFGTNEDIDQANGSGQTNSIPNSNVGGAEKSILWSGIDVLTYLFMFLALILAGMIFFSYIRWKEELKVAKHKFSDAYKGDVDTGEPTYKHPRWQTVLGHASSLNQSEWRLAILEADTMLAELLDKRGYPGLSIGEQLKAVDSEKFKSIQDAWDAHRVRNQIAHEGSAFVLTEREARRVIGLYERVFKEFDFI